jgi:hydrogenase/urease accessory protein HupE
VEMASESAWLFLGETLNSAPNVERSLPRLKAKAAEAYLVAVDGRTLQPRETDAALREEDGVVLRLVFPRPAEGTVRFEATYLKRLPPAHRTTLTLIEGERLILTELMNFDEPFVRTLLPALAPATGAPLSPATVTRAGAPVTSFRGFLKLGIGHILTGYDHLLFLCGLLVVCRRFSSTLAIITCFTIAHSITLALAALGVVVFPSRFVEPLIAASIVFVGIENLVHRGGEPKGRWLLTFGFGLIHGFGFAGVLREIGLGADGSSIVAPLLAFNLGVEIGQAVVALVFLPLLWKLRTRPQFLRLGEPAISVLVVVLGGYWLLQRTVFS